MKRVRIYLLMFWLFFLVLASKSHMNKRKLFRKFNWFCKAFHCPSSIFRMGMGDLWGSPVITFQILIWRSVGWDIWFRILTIQDWSWLDQSGASMRWPIWRLNSDHILLSDFDLEVCGPRYWMSKFNQSWGTMARPIRSQYVLTNRETH